MVRKRDCSEASEAGVVVAGVERAHVEFILNEAELHLARMEPSATRRRLELAVEMFWSTVDSWGARPPTGEQLNLIRDHVAEVLHLARSSDPLRRSA
jgi:hypothetical protein